MRRAREEEGGSGGKGGDHIIEGAWRTETQAVDPHAQHALAEPVTALGGKRTHQIRAAARAWGAEVACAFGPLTVCDYPRGLVDTRRA